ncbi:hypothetical protein CLV68_0527 [Actinokineospora cianjurensis]|uniref:Uncharacterized protein n=1 Tax=Actinokineospora cianjurensis TaxID=585224 RepID=A0A421B734_9PSEU|nr:hypothetical protein CLV68_0527 [Actinokineospora cianjurensis]
MARVLGVLVALIAWGWDWEGAGRGVVVAG